MRGARTIALGVTEGAVVFHRRDGTGDVRLTAGSSWAAPTLASIAGATSDSPSNAVPSSVPLVLERAPPPTSAVPARPTPAMSLSTAKAAQSATVVDEHADEDAAYLRVIALVREGRAADARLAARAYLLRFSHGLPP